MKPARNKPCPCGSGKKFKHCCEGKAASGIPPPPAEINPLISLYNAGRFAELESKAHDLTGRYPYFGFGWKLLGSALQIQGKDALSAFREAAELMPDDAEAHYNLGVALKSTGLLAEAAASYRMALQIKPEYAEALNNLGNILKELGQLRDAADSYRRALELKPNSAEAHNNLGMVLQRLGQNDDAAVCYHRALAIKPDHAAAHYNLGVIQHESGKLDEAAASYRQVVQLKPDFADAFNNLGLVLTDLGQFNEAVASYFRAVEIKPDDADVYNNLGIALKSLGKFNEAITSYRRALEIEPDYAKAHNNLGIAQHDLGESDAALASYCRALEIEPDYAKAHNNLAMLLQALGQMDAALASYRGALELEPDYAEARSNLLFCLSHNEAVDAKSLFAEHCRFGEQFEAPLRRTWSKHGNALDPQRPLQVGFVSGDFYNHAVASFIEPVLAHLSGYPQLSLHGYYNYTVEDAVNQRLRGYLTHWHPVAGLPDAVLAQKIREDGIDILIDLSGHTGKNRLLTFARKPAPVQASWMGYPGTTGLSAMDYYLADPFFLPPRQYDNQFIEKLVYLPANAPFLPSTSAPMVNALPALVNGYLTFGSFNRLSKLGRSVIALWSQLLRALPDSRMLLAGLPEEGKYGTLIDWFAQEGITRERVDFHVRSDMQRYLSLHHQVDVCLDTYPYTGGTTTLHALWMGVPTLTLAGHTAAGRQGAAILGHASLEEFVAHDAADFVRKGLSLAGDLAALSAIRARLRERFAQSAMGQPVLIAAGLERALRVMWQRWCAGLPPAVIDVSKPQTVHKASPLQSETNGKQEQ
jgi:protein O-GlcNAc transferase